jgi:hypothetical protein
MSTEKSKIFRRMHVPTKIATKSPLSHVIPMYYTQIGVVNFRFGVPEPQLVFPAE